MCDQEGGVMRRFFGSVMTLALAAVAACGGGADTAEEGMAEDTSAAATTPPAEQGGMAMAGELPEGVTQEMVAEGQTIFTGMGTCTICHGPDAKGTTLGPDLTDDQWLNTTGHNYDEIVAVVTNGVQTPKQYPGPMMPRAGTSMTDEQVRAVAAYVYTLSGH
jgi:mono/diheme cytochrome c family protein